MTGEMEVELREFHSWDQTYICRRVCASRCGRLLSVPATTDGRTHTKSGVVTESIYFK
jgi:hypothetical protein